jgi:hypothetical protein
MANKTGGDGKRRKGKGERDKGKKNQGKVNARNSRY